MNVDSIVHSLPSNLLNSVRRPSLVRSGFAPTVCGSAAAATARRLPAACGTAVRALL
jgi:hypothetical protein